MADSGNAPTILIELTAGIVAAFVGHNNLPASDLPSLIKGIFGALSGTAEPLPAPVTIHKPSAVSLKKSITDDYLICLEDGRKFKSLKRHLRSKYNLSPEEYRAKWDLPASYPMVAPAYAAARSALAKASGLGVGGRTSKAKQTPTKRAVAKA